MMNDTNSFFSIFLNIYTWIMFHSTDFVIFVLPFQFCKSDDPIFHTVFFEQREWNIQYFLSYSGVLWIRNQKLNDELIKLYEYPHSVLEYNQAKYRYRNIIASIYMLCYSIYKYPIELVNEPWTVRCDCDILWLDSIHKNIYESQILNESFTNDLIRWYEKSLIWTSRVICNVLKKISEWLIGYEKYELSDLYAPGSNLYKSSKTYSIYEYHQDIKDWIKHIIDNDEERKYWFNIYMWFFYLDIWRYDFALIHFWFIIESDIVPWCKRELKKYLEDNKKDSIKISKFDFKKDDKSCIEETPNENIHLKTTALVMWLSYWYHIQINKSWNFQDSLKKNLDFLLNVNDFRNSIIHNWWSMKFQDAYKYIPWLVCYLNEKSIRDWRRSIFILPKMKKYE